MSRAIASMSTRVTCPARASVGGGGARRSAVATKAHRGRDDDEQIITERRVHVDAAAFTVTRRRLALTLATALALEPVTRARSPASAGALTDMVKRKAAWAPTSGSSSSTRPTSITPFSTLEDGKYFETD